MGSLSGLCVCLRKGALPRLVVELGELAGECLLLREEGLVLGSLLSVELFEVLCVGSGGCACLVGVRELLLGLLVLELEDG